MQETEKLQKKLPNQEVDYFKIGKILLSRWYWIAGTVLTALAISNIYLWYTPKLYQTSSLIKFEDKKPDITDLASPASSNSSTAIRIQSELFVLQSSQLLLRAIKDLDYQVSFYIAGRVRTTETYPQKPLDIQFLRYDSLNLFRDLIAFKAHDNNQFNLTYKIAGKNVSRVYAYNTPITIGPTTFSIKNPGGINPNSVFQFKFNLPEDFLGRARGGFHAGEISKYSNIISLSETDSNPQFAADILNAIMTEYLKYDLEQKTKSASQIIDFIDKQLAFLSSEVKGSERSLQEYQQKNRIVDISNASTSVLEKARKIETDQELLKMQLFAIDQLKDQLLKEKDNVNLNFNLSGTVDPMLSQIISNFNNLLNEKNSLLKIYNANAQPVADINRQILVIKNAAINNVNSSRNIVQKNLDYQNKLAAQVEQQMASLPVSERSMVGLQRNYEINEKVYSFLSEKKLDAQISNSAILPGASIVERAQPNYGPVSPNEHDVNRMALIIGLVSGLGIIILIRLLNPYIYDKETVESLTTIPIIGVIRKFPADLDEDNSQLLALTKPRSLFAESVRSVRTNLSFLASEKDHKVICITSEIAGEGKSFVAVNISSTLALISKKVILIGADLRRSKLHRTFHANNDNGLSNYLASQCHLEDILHQSEIENLDFITSGPVPPNPSELLHNVRMRELIDDLKKTYDFIVIDTAPIGLVSDSIPLIRMSDINVFVIRSGKSKYYSATIPQRMAQEYHLDNTVIVLNAFAEDLLHSRYYTTRITGDGYGNRYYYYSDYSGYSGSGYYIDDDEKRKWWDVRKWFRIK
ncbi:capsular exopolysaccharide synthesis family protein [Mucilaginibacter yixingensis]|uniref:non-specific protein-tyrosine kinase n=1 Tax=Mucilaginibacter yixingensis TaxID=1295612 RepID=A0A2T5JFT7_9SPHI|nr:tyrosine-protein kinase family protein [Mucilaginibacter yixingensis]PTR01291.1 capsular exopolysaccharide synthesis family protein [Mucilaginibacter yixingensis]